MKPVRNSFNRFSECRLWALACELPERAHQFICVQNTMAALVAAILFLLPVKAFADPFDDAPPIAQSVDANGMNLFDQSVQLVIASASVGQQGKGGLEYDFVNPWSYSNDKIGQGASANSIWDGYVSEDTSEVTVVIKGQTTPFLRVGSAFTPEYGSGASLTYDGTNFYFTGRDGTTAVFVPQAGCPYCVAGLLSTLTYPSGETLTFHYRYSTTYAYEYVVGAVTSNLGYELKFNYRCTDDSTPTCFTQIAQAVAINNTVDYCDPAANSCAGMAQTWPTVNILYPLNSTLPSAVTDPTGITTTFSSTYDPSTHITTRTITRPSGRKWSVSWNDDTNPNDMTLYDGVANWDYNFTYDDIDSTVTILITDPAGHQRSVHANAGTGQILSDTLDPSGLNLQTLYSYDSYNRLQTVTYPEGNYVEYIFDSEDATSRGNIVETRQYEKPSVGTSYLSTKSVYPSTCDSSNFRICNQPTSITDANGNTTDYTYDANSGNVLTTTAPSVGGGKPVTQFGYQALHAWYNDGSGSIVQAPTAVYEPTQTISCSFADASNWSAASPPSWGAFVWGGCAGSSSQRITTVGYTAGGPTIATNLLPASTTIASGTGAVTSTVGTTYDRLGNVVSTSGPLSGQATIYLFDYAHTNLGTIGPDPGGSGPLGYPATKVTLDIDGRATETEQGTATSQSFDAWPSNFSSPSLKQSTTTYTMSFFDEVAEQRSYIGGTFNTPVSVTQFSYVGARLPLCTAIRMTPAVFGSLPDACTQSTSLPTPSDQISYSTYDTANRLSGVEVGYGTASPITQVANTYTNNSKISTVEDGNGNRTSYFYYGSDRLAAIRYPSKTVPHTSNPADYEAFQYDNNGNVVSHTQRDGETFLTTYDALNRVTQKIDPATGNTYIFYSYDFLNNLLSAHFGSLGGYGTDFTYDALGRKLTETSSTTTYRRTVSSTYDAAGNRTSLTYPDGSTVNYTYDLLNRMRQIVHSSTVLVTYGYDDLGRVTGITRSNGTATGASYNASNANWSMSQSLVNASQNLTMGYTVNPGGQMTQRSIDNSAYAYSAPSASTGYAPNGLNQYDSVNSIPYNYSSDGNLTSDGSRTFGYDFGNRLTSVSGTASMNLSYDAAGRMQQTASGTNTEQYLYDGNALIAEYDGSGNLLRHYIPGATPDDTEVWYEGSGYTSPHWLFADERGSVIGASDASGSAATYNYSVTGEPGGGWSTSSPTPIFRYTGQAALSAIGLYYYKTRMYDPVLGRFLQTDTIGYSGGMNLYAYAGNDPANYTDSLGTTCGNADPKQDASPDPYTGDAIETAVVIGICPRENPIAVVWGWGLNIIDTVGNLVSGGSASPSSGTNNGPQKGNVCPSPGAMSAYKFGGGLGQFGGKAVTYGAALQVATAPGYLTPFTAPAAAAGTAAGALSETIGGEAAFGGTTIQVVAGTVIYLQTGDSTPLFASGAPAVASALSPLNGLIGPSLEDRLQGYLESRSPTLRNCGG